MDISIQNLSKTYKGGVTALDGVNLDIATGMFGLLGPNGAGKSTMMKILSTLLEPTTGQVRIGGLDISKDRRAIRARLGYLPQEFGIYPKLRVREFLDMIARMNGMKAGRERADRVDEMLEQVGLAEASRRKIKALSGDLGVSNRIIEHEAPLFFA